MHANGLRNLDSEQLATSLMAALPPWAHAPIQEEYRTAAILGVATRPSRRNGLNQNAPPGSTPTTNSSHFHCEPWKPCQVNCRLACDDKWKMEKSFSSRSAIISNESSQLAQ